MEFEFSFFSILLTFSIFVILLLQKLTVNKPKSNLPPGPRKLPFIGNLHHFLTSSDPPHHKLRKLAKKYGPLMHLQLGELHFIIVSSPELAKHFMKTHDIIFASRPRLLAEFSCYGDADMVFTPYGEYWRQMRKICTLQLLSAKRVESFRPVREQELWELCKSIALRAGSPIDLTEKISTTNYDIMAKVALGKKTNEQATFIRVFREAVDLMNVFHLADVYPSIRFLRRISWLKKKIDKLQKQSDRIIGEIIEDRIRVNAKNIDDDDERGKREDLLDVLLKFLDCGALEMPLTTVNVKAVILDIFGAGIETSTTVVDWAMVEMLKNPRILKKAQDEVRQLFDRKCCHVNESYLDELKYLKLVIKETLRLHPPSALFPRESREDCEINGYKIPAKARVLVNVWALGRDPEYWEDGESFKPERFIEKMVDYKDNTSFEYVPFGAGRRMCPGVTFGIANVKIVLAMLLYYFDWDLPDGMKPEDTEMTESIGLVARRKNSLRVVPFVKRSLPSDEIRDEMPNEINV